MYIEKWTLEKVKKGFEEFYKIHNRYPTAYDVDDFDSLPSSRQIQRRFGGLEKLRKDLGLEIENYTSGDERSNKIAAFNKRGRECENIVYQVLIDFFDEKFIHIERPTCGNVIVGAYDNKSRYDFYVYAKPKNFAIDVFGTNDTRGIISNLNMKEKKYNKLNTQEDIYFVYFGNSIDKNKIKTWISNKKNKLPHTWKVVDLDEFKSSLLAYSSYGAA
ncbi:MAG: hypothetical protein NTY33_03545 [Candidatus Moranbacteria bacterium]|nr:hypothetical protein [Candidatus Moranbacteria bacterium]